MPVSLTVFSLKVLQITRLIQSTKPNRITQPNNLELTASLQHNMPNANISNSKGPITGTPTHMYEYMATFYLELDVYFIQMTLVC